MNTPNTDEAVEAAMRVLRVEVPGLSGTRETTLVISALARAGQLREVMPDNMQPDEEGNRCPESKEP